MTPRAASYRSSMLLSSTSTRPPSPSTAHIGPNMMAALHVLGVVLLGGGNYNVGRVANGSREGGRASTLSFRVGPPS
jgi:hypothetical protein